MPRLDVPARTTAAIFVRRTTNGKTTYVREQYNVVSMDFGDGTPIQTFVEPISGGARSASERAEVYDDVRFYDASPFPGTRIGY